MKYLDSLSNILIIDDLFGRTHKDQRNQERKSLCGFYLLNDISKDQEGKGSITRLKNPIANAVFFRGQHPLASDVGDFVENDLEKTIKIIANGWNKPPYWSMILLDLCFYTGIVTESSNNKIKGMPVGQSRDDDPKYYYGLKLLSEIKNKFPGLPVVILSSKPEDEVSLDYTKLGALGFIPRSDEDGPDRLKDHIYRNSLMHDTSGEIVGHSKALMYALREIRRSAAQGGRRNLMLRGESGTGKRLFASYAHQQRMNINKDIPFYDVNCPQISQELFASELFGHKKGAFTDAKEDKQGIIEKANGGDVFLDEVADLPLGVQAGILKVIEERVYTRLGETNKRTSDVRFLSATNSSHVDLRDDLLMRLTEGGTITLPPLRERKDDIPLLVEKFVKNAEKITKARERKIEYETITKLMGYNWPGNVRELQNCIYKAVQQYSQLPYLVPEHIKLPDNNVISELETNQRCHGISVCTNPSVKEFKEYALPMIIDNQNKNIVLYIISALESYRDRRNNEPNYPKTWHAMTGQDLKSSSTCQRNIGNYIYQLDNSEIIKLMNESTVFSKAVIQCGKKIRSATLRLKELEKITRNIDE